MRIFSHKRKKNGGQPGCKPKKPNAYPPTSLSATQALSTTNARSQLLANLPIDIINEIFSHLSPVSSTCLGLTCKALYETHKKRYPHGVGLHEVERLQAASDDEWWLGDMIIIRDSARHAEHKNIILGDLLTSWVGAEAYLLHRIVKCPMHVEDFHVVAAGIRSAVFLRREGRAEEETEKKNSEWGLLLERVERMFVQRFVSRSERGRLVEVDRMERHLRLIPRMPRPRVPRVVTRNFPRRIRD